MSSILFGFGSLPFNRGRLFYLEKCKKNKTTTFAIEQLQFSPVFLIQYPAYFVKPCSNGSQ